jgi:hypothetical protein
VELVVNGVTVLRLLGTRDALGTTTPLLLKEGVIGVSLPGLKATNQLRTATSNLKAVVLADSLKSRDGETKNLLSSQVTA